MNRPCSKNIQNIFELADGIGINCFISNIHLPQVHFSDSNLRDCPFLLITGPKLPMGLFRHAMVELGNGQAIIGGFGYESQDKIYLFSCMDRNCSIHQLSQELSVPRYWFVAIPIPDTLSGCITGGKKFHKTYTVSLQLFTLTPSIRDRVHRNENFDEINPV